MALRPGHPHPKRRKRPAGYHDDCVIALALANAERYQFKPTGAIHVLPPAPKAARLRVLAG